MTRLAWLAPLIVILAAATIARAGTDSDMLTQFGLIGSWAIDCRAPPSLANPFQNFVPSTEGQPSRQLITGNPDYDRIEPISGVALIAADRLRLSFPQNGIMVTVVLAKDKGRIRPIESATSNGETVVSGGIVQRNGQETSWLQKCPG